MRKSVKFSAILLTGHQTQNPKILKMEQNDIKINLHSIGTKAQTCIYIYIYIHGELEI